MLNWADIRYNSPTVMIVTIGVKQTLVFVQTIILFNGTLTKVNSDKC